MTKLWPLYLAIFFTFVGFSIQIPVFTSMMLGPAHRDIVDVYLGVMLGLYPLGQFFGSPVLGALSDRLGRKPIVLISLSMSMICYMFISISLMYNLLLLLCLFLFLAGLCDGNIAITQGAITDVTNETERSRYFGYIYVVSACSFIVGPLLSSFFSRFGISPSFWAVVILLLAVILCIAYFFKETHHLEKRQKRNLLDPLMNLINIFHDHSLTYYYVVNFIIYLSIFGYLRVYPMYVQEMYHTDLALLSLVVAYVSLPFIIMNLIAVPILAKSRWKLPKPLTMLFSWLMGCFMILIVVPDDIRFLWITLFTTTAAVALTMTFSAVLLSLMVDHKKQGAVMGNNQSLLSLAQALSAFFAGTFAALATRLPLIIFGFLAIFAGTMLFRKKD